MKDVIKIVSVVACMLLSSCDPTLEQLRVDYDTVHDCIEEYVGIGYMGFATNVSGTYSIAVFETRDSTIEPFANFVMDQTPTAVSFQVVSDAVASQATFEYAYEKEGLPIVSTMEGWLEVRIGYDNSGSPILGWVSQESQHLEVALWKEVFENQALFIATCEEPRFYDAIGGTQVEPALRYIYDDTRAIKRLDYRIAPISIDGNWMKANLITPNDECGEPVEEVEEYEVWFQYLGEDGTPNVWFPTRGC